MKQNSVKEMLRAGELVMVAEINRVFSPKIVDVLSCLGCRCLWIDMEHSDATYDQVYNMICAARAGDLPAIVRIPRGTYNTVIKPLELGAMGLVMPHCMGAADAREYVRNGKFAPLGLRGLGGGVDSNFGTMCLPDYTARANQETLLAVMIEDKEAVDAADDIAAVDGVDLMFIGPADLSQSYGITGQMDHPLMLEAEKKVAAAAKKHGKFWGSVRGNDEHVRRIITLGAQWINVINDTSALFDGYGKAMTNLQELLQRG